MSYSTLENMEKLVPRPKIDELCKDAVGGAGEVVPGLIEEADGTIDLYNTQQWGDAAKLGCSRALAIEMLFSRHGTGKIPKTHADRAADWKGRLEAVGLRAMQAWYRAAHDPTQNETDEELERLTTRDLT